MYKNIYIYYISHLSFWSVKGMNQCSTSNPSVSLAHQTHLYPLSTKKPFNHVVAKKFGTSWEAFRDLPRFSFDRNLDNVLLLRHHGDQGLVTPFQGITPWQGSGFFGRNQGTLPGAEPGATEMQRKITSQIFGADTSARFFEGEMVCNMLKPFD